MNRVSIDFETRSAVDLRKTGVDRYAEDPTTGIWCLAYSLDGKHVHVWKLGEPDPEPILNAIASGATITGWNTAFESSIFHYTVRRLFPHWPQPRLEQWCCTMSRALALALPGGLDNAGEALKTPIKKDKIGQRLMLKMCKPTPAWRKWYDAGRIGLEPSMWHDSPEDVQRLAEYCRQDVAAEMAIGERIAQLTPSERANWLLNERVNRRGIRLDLPKIEPALGIVSLETKRLNRELATLTEGAVPKVTNAAKLMNWLSDELHPLPDLKKRTVATALAQRISNPTVRRVLEIRQEASKASVAKLKAMLACVNADGRARGLLGYHTATTGRAASRRIQVQNMIRAFLKAHEINEVLALLVSDAELDAIADSIRFGYADPIAAIASCLRSLIIPSPGRVLIGGDYSNVEGRVTAWLAGEKWKLKAFEDADAGKGTEIYILAYARSFGADPATIKKSDPRRQVGKVQELSLGFGGGPFALLSMCLLYMMNVADMADAVKAITDRYIWEDTEERYIWEDTEERYPEDPEKQRGLSKHVWTGLRVVVDAWRDAHPDTVEFWYELERCAINAVLNPQTTFTITSGLISYRFNGNFLFAQLPSGRCLAYAHAHVRWVRRADSKVMPANFEPSREEMGKAPRPYKRSLLYWGQGKKSKKWEVRKAWYGMLAENVVQATARDIMFAGMHRAEAAGYPIVLHVHDEMVSEVGHNFGSAEELQRIMCTPETWMKGLPVAAAAVRMDRYGKG
jgi:DNA polymerase